MEFAKTVARMEAFFKGMVFDCHTCGQCVLKQTGWICPMSCPKGLRNGPCGGTLDGECEVYPDKKCVWIQIYNRTGKESLETPSLIASPDSSLFHTSSYLNYLNGKDQKARIPLSYLDLGENRTEQPVQTASLLEEKLKNGLFVRTCEIRSPQEGDFSHVQKEALKVKDHFDAINATAFLNGRPSLPSPSTAAELVEMGIEAISQATCRDHTKTSFISELIQNRMHGVYNILCLTGDSYVGDPKIKQVFDLDASLMLYEARCLREHGRIHFTGARMKNPPRSFLGAAINPFTTPGHIPIRRLKQKAAAGADFIQTQMIFDLDHFQEFMADYCGQNLHRDLFLLAGIPVVISQKALNMLPHIPGVKLPPAVAERFAQAKDLKQEGIQFAREMVEAVRETPGVRGVHLMLFGSNHAVLPGIINVLGNVYGPIKPQNHRRKNQPGL